MGEVTKIAWCDHTFNPWIGCSKISAGCANCYAETFVTTHMKKTNLWGPLADRQRTKQPWKDVVKWNRDAHLNPSVSGIPGIHMVFLGSMMDWAEGFDDILAPIRADMWKLIKDCPNLHFQMLTKRPHHIESMLPSDWGTGYQNVWLGTSIEDMRVAHRQATLGRIPAAVKFISYEPALGSLDKMDLWGIDWVIYGGESGPGYRPENKDWARSMKARCAGADIAFFHKQSAAPRTEMGIELDGEIIREFPDPFARIDRRNETATR